MKKIIYALIIPLLFITRVHAATSVYISRLYDIYPFYDDFYSNNSSVIDNLVSYYNTNWSNSYSNYIIYGDYLSSGMTSSHYIYIVPTNSTDITARYDSNSHYYIDLDDILCSNGVCRNVYRYVLSTNEYELISSPSSKVSTWNLLFSSKQTLHFKSTSLVDALQFPSYSNLELDVSFPQMTFHNGDTIPTYISLTNGTPQADFTQVDMSQYEYIILSLKNYDTTTFNTTIYSLGRLCFTPVYNYGMTPKQDYLNGYQTQSCTEYYNTSTPVPIYIIQADLDNHAVYYIKRYESETNILQIPTSIFDITYITSQNANNPQVTIGGRSYPAIPYSDLTDTANISTDEGYISGQVCTLGDINCQTNQSGMDISDLFTQPLKVLQSVWTSITSVFILIGEFIALIPSPLKEFLISAFMLSIILGILKIIL